MKITPEIKYHRGFTLAELMIVIAIIIILAGIVIGSMGFVKTRQRNNQAEIQIKLLENAIQQYHTDNGEYPGDADAGGSIGTGESNMLFRALFYDGFLADDNSLIYLSELDPATDVQKWIDGTGAGATIVDPWGVEYRYRRGSGALNPDYDLWSVGPDGESAGDGEDDKDKDDISNF
jgi:prepilin-type N-terminal cleavage/methylation domain-containing protein